MKRLLAGLILVCSAVPARAVFLGGVDQSFGKRDYKGTDVYAGVNLGGFSITPEYRRWSDQDSNGGFNEAQARVGYDMRWFGAGVTAGGTARHEQYSNAFGGADFAFTISPMGDTSVRRIGGSGRAAAPTGKGLARVDFGAGVMATHHKQEADASLGIGAASLNQTDLNAFVGGSFLDILVSARYSKSRYSVDLKNNAVPVPQYESIAGHLFYNGAGYPDQTVLLSAEFGMLPLVAPFVNFARTSYMEQLAGFKPGDTRAYTAGVRVGLDMLSLQASYQRLSVTGGDDTNYTSIGAGLRF